MIRETTLRVDDLIYPLFAVHGRGVRELKKLLRMLREYPRQPLLDAIVEAERFGLYNLDRLERMVLRRIGREYFLLPQSDDNQDFNDTDDDDDER